MMAAALGGFFGSIFGLGLIGLVLMQHQKALENKRRADMNKALLDLTDELTSKVDSAILAGVVQDLSNVPQPRAEA